MYFRKDRNFTSRPYRLIPRRPEKYVTVSITFRVGTSVGHFETSTIFQGRREKRERERENACPWKFLDHGNNKEARKERSDLFRDKDRAIRKSMSGRRKGRERDTSWAERATKTDRKYHATRDDDARVRAKRF